MDKDGGGSISADEMKDAIFEGKKDLSNIIDDQIWQEIIDEVDEDQSGVIEFDEFCAMIRNLLQDDPAET